jgi:hypothetical protein
MIAARADARNGVRGASSEAGMDESMEARKAIISAISSTSKGQMA